MISDLRVCLLQGNIIWENPTANSEYFESLLRGLETPVDLIVLPEMFSTGFSMNPERCAEKHSAEMHSLQWMKSIAAEFETCVCGSIAVEDSGKFYNRLYWVQSDGQYFTYNKRHLFSFGNEHLHYTAGNSRLIVNCKGWKICPLICYDLRFPVWSRNSANEGTPTYDVLMYVANWPNIRSTPWNLLNKSRAIENQCYNLAVNRVGTDPNAIEYHGDSMVISPKGEVLASLHQHAVGRIIFNLSYQDLIDFRTKFPALMDADDFKLG